MTSTASSLVTRRQIEFYEKESSATTYAVRETTQRKRKTRLNNGIDKNKLLKRQTWKRHHGQQE
jgi:hypothetical protein